MLGEKAYELIKELDRNRDNLPPYNNDLVKEVKNEISHLVAENQEDVNLEALNTTANDSGASTEAASLIPTIKIRHSAVKRNIRCLIAYHYNRIRNLRTMRWEFGSVLPPDIKSNLSAAEIEWFSKYLKNIAQYMRTIGDEGGVNLAVDLKPPKALYIEVRCLVDYGRYELSDGAVVLLKKNSRHYLPRCECEEFIRQGVFEHVLI